MTQAPERIWAFNAKQTGYRFYANGPQPEFDNVEYVRADLAQAPAPVRVKPEDVFETCGACMGSGYGGHPDSGAICPECDGSGGQLVAALDTPDAALMAELVEAAKAFNGPVLDDPKKMIRAVDRLRAVLAKLGVR